MSHESKLLEQHFSAVAAIEETWLWSFGQEACVTKVVAVWCPIGKQCCFSKRIPYGGDNIACH